MKVGDRVRLLEDSEFYHQAPDCLGTIIRLPYEASSSNWCEVEWDTGYIDGYRWIDTADEPRDIELVEARHQRVFQVGTSVRLRPNSRFYHQAPDGMIGTITEIHPGGWCRVRWSNGTVNGYAYRDRDGLPPDLDPVPFKVVTTRKQRKE